MIGLTLYKEQTTTTYIKNVRQNNGNIISYFTPFLFWRYDKFKLFWSVYVYISIEYTSYFMIQPSVILFFFIYLFLYELKSLTYLISKEYKLLKPSWLELLSLKLLNLLMFQEVQHPKLSWHSKPRVKSDLTSMILNGRQSSKRWTAEQ